MANGKQLSQKGADFILDLMDSYIDVKEAVTPCVVRAVNPNEIIKDFYDRDYEGKTYELGCGTCDNHDADSCCSCGLGKDFLFFEHK